MSARFKALNLDSSDESKTDTDAPTKEALEEKATALYMEALQFQASENWDKAEDIYQNLLESEVLSKVNGRVTFINGRIKPSLEHLKYCCYQNLGHVLVAKNQLEDGLELYKKALELDDTDLNLWYKIGLIGMKLVDLNVAISAFQEALEINPRHFPSLDNLITATYAQGGLLTCLHYIARALEYNPKYKKGLALKDKLFKNHPTMKEHYLLFNPYPNYKLEIAEDSDLDDKSTEQWYHEVMNLRAAEVHPPSPKTQTAPYSLPCRPSTWEQLAILLSAAHSQLYEEAPFQDFFRPVNLMSEKQFSDVKMEFGTEMEQTAADEEVDNINNEVFNDGEDVEPMGVRGKRRRSSPTSLEQMYTGKRRSTRARNTARKEEPTLARTLSKLVPPALLVQSEDGKKENEVVRWNDDSMDTMDMYRLFENKDMGKTSEAEITNTLSEVERAKTLKEEGYFGSEEEAAEVNTFLENNTELDVLTLIKKLVHILSKKWKLLWPIPLPAIYVQLYKVHLQHNPPVTSIPSLLHTEDEGAACVLFGELLLGQWLQTGKSRGKPSPLTGSCMGGDFPSLLLGDLQDLNANSLDPVFNVRYLWMHTLLSLYADDVNTAINKLSILLNSGHLESVNVCLLNVTHHYIINKMTVEIMLSTLNRKQMVDELTELYHQDDCEQIVAILSEVLQPSKFGGSLFQPSMDRDAQYSLLLYTLWRLDRINECIQWAETFVHESMTQLLAAVAEDNSELRTKWLVIINNTILCILTCVHHKGSEVFGALEKNRLSRLTQSLCHVICRQMETGQILDSEFDIISPWMLLYEIISNCEETSDTLSSTIAEERLPRSLRLLFTAHEYLGRRAWCCLDEAVILYQTLYQLQSIMDLYFPESEEYSVLSQQLEQIVYCLYGHPIKRNKPRYLQEHNVNGITLTWTRSHQVLALLRPKELPTYDSSSKCSISADTEALFKRIIDLMPPENNPSHLTEQMIKYIDGSVDEIPANGNPLPPEMADIYYLIADHHFKNKTWNKAIKFFLLDVCNNPERVDSWACLALARGSILETKLNSCDPLKSESDFLKKALMSCRCYKKSLDLDSALPTLWIEYGSFSYMVHSFCSRLLKQEQNLSLEMFEFLETQKENMIQTSLLCFTSANKLWYTEDGQEMQDERWLHHYMLGKIAEKRQEPASQCLSHYLKSMEFLHLNNAEYPSLVTYNTPQWLAVEALELYYRVHAVILKTLEQSEDKPLDGNLRKLFGETLDKMLKGPFARKVTRREESEGLNSVNKTIYIDSEETRMAAVKRLVDSVLEIVEADVDFVDGSVEDKKREAEPNEKQAAKRVKREDSQTSQESKEERKLSKKAERNSTESSSDSDSDSDSSSSESSSSVSSGSGDESSDEEKSTDEKKEVKKDSEKNQGNWKKEQEVLTTACLDALEDCAQRFPEHYKSLYRLAHFYFRSNHHRNVDKAWQLMLGERGLFANRKHYNFFNAVWRIPSNEIDRPGSFAAHMSRCVLLLVDILRHFRDHKLLFDLALRLRDTPESDKKYLRDPEREELSREALSLSVQALRKKVTEAKSPEDQKSVLLDTFKIYKRCNKSWEQKQSLFATLLIDAYTQLKKEENSNVLEAAIRFCTQDVTSQKSAAAVTSTPATASSSPDISQASSPVQIVPPLPAQQKPTPLSTAPVKRGRGRPSTNSLRQQNPGSFKQTSRNSAEMAQMYHNMTAMQRMNQTSASANQALLTQAMINPAMMNQNQQMMLGNAAMAFSQQLYQTEVLRKQILLQQQMQKSVQLQAFKNQSKNSTPTSQHITATPTTTQTSQHSSQTKSLSSINSLLAPSKVSVFSSQSILPQNQFGNQPPKHVSQSSTSLNSNQLSISKTSAVYQQGIQPTYMGGKQNLQPSKQSYSKPSPFQQKTLSEPKVSLQHKILSAKAATSSVSTGSMTVSLIGSTKQTKEKKSHQMSTSVPTAALSSRGVSITPTKPPEIKIPKDINIGHGLSISPVSATKTKSPLSPSVSKELTLTLVKPQSDQKVLKTGSISVSIVDSKKSLGSPGVERSSSSPKLRVGGAVTITPAKGAVAAPVKTIPKADFSISLSKNENKKKDEKVITID